LICAASHKTIAHEYIDGVLSGEIVACKLVKSACERHLRDLQRQNSDEFPFWFDEREADDVCAFFPLALRHSKGEKFAGNPLDLQPWQVFIMWVLFGWKRCDDNSRRFRRAHISVARKNGKSTVAAGIGLYGLTCDCEPGAEIYVSATKKEQAKCVFEEAERMRTSSPKLKSLVTSHVNNLFVKTSNSFFRPTSSDKPLDGPNPHFTIFDELHAWREVHRKFYNTMITGGGSRTQPMQVTITTAGDDQSFIWLEEYNHCTAVAHGTIIDETMFVYIAEIDDGDDPLDESVWMKANPNLGVSVSMEYMRQQARDAVNKPTFYSVFVSKHCNKITSSNEKAFDMDAWDKCAGTLSNWDDCDAVGAGVDLGGRDDLASYGQVAKFANDDGTFRFEIRTRSYIADNSPRDLAKQPFSQWIYDGFLTKTPYPQTDLEEDLVETCERIGCEMIAYDPSGAVGLSESLKQAGFKPLRMAQNQSMFNEPIKELLQAVKDGRVVHDGNPLLRWAVNNAVLYKNRQGDVMFDKSKSAEKIDPIVAVTMAFRVACIAPARYRGKLFIN
jgi:phage terminase large subunit-like protein